MPSTQALEYAIALYAYCSIGGEPSKFRILVAVAKTRPEEEFKTVYALVEHTLGDKCSLLDSAGEHPPEFLEKLLEDWAANYPEAKTDIYAYDNSEHLRIEVFRSMGLVPDPIAILTAYDEIIAAEET